MQDGALSARGGAERPMSGLAMNPLTENGEQQQTPTSVHVRAGRLPRSALGLVLLILPVLALALWWCGA